MDKAVGTNPDEEEKKKKLRELRFGGANLYSTTEEAEKVIIKFLIIN